ncbi:hypothetical protein [Bartonella raoultii]|uniref:hypothetical protein n=1 Tax=Bartonella raoultii TaxID=1457020 RepID=UPI001ABBC8A1|nr:hypothetical protein [Bartonella raoultii]
MTSLVISDTLERGMLSGMIVFMPNFAILLLTVTAINSDFSTTINSVLEPENHL